MTGTNVNMIDEYIIGPTHTFFDDAFSFENYISLLCSDYGEIVLCSMGGREWATNKILILHGLIDATCYGI